MEPMSSYWRREGLEERIGHFNVPVAAKRFVLGLDPDTDLRSVEIPGLDRYRPSHGAMLAEHVFAPGFRFVEPFVNGVPLGDLGGVQVYSTDAYDRYQGKAHAAGACQHSGSIRRDDDLLTVGEWVRLATVYDARDWFDRPLCSKCGGFAVRRLSAEQARYLDTAIEIADCADSVAWYERNLGADHGAVGATSVNHPRVGEDLDDLRDRLSSLPRQETLAEFVETLEERISALEAAMADDSASS